MSSKQYDLPCPHCEHSIRLNARQAGQEVDCPGCKETVVAPRLGALRQLEPVGGDDSPAPKTGSGTGNGIFVAGLLLLVVGLAAGISLYQYGQSIIIPFNLEGGVTRGNEYLDPPHEVDGEVIGMTNSEIAILFDDMNIDSGLGEWQEQPHVAVSIQGNILKQVGYAFMGLGGLGALLMVVGLLFFRR